MTVGGRGRTGSYGGFGLGGDCVSFSTEDGEVVVVLSLPRYRPEDIIGDARRDPTVDLEEDLLCFCLETLDYGLELEHQGRAVR